MVRYKCIIIIITVFIVNILKQKTHIISNNREVAYRSRPEQL